VRRGVQETIAVNPAFLRWFGDSKVRSADGQPLVVWHASRPDTDAFDTFDLERAFDIGVHFGIHFGTYEAAATFGGKPHPFFLKIERPLRLTDAGDWLEIGRRTSTIDQLAMLGLLDKPTYDRIYEAIEERKKALKVPGTGGEGWLRSSQDKVAVEWRRLRTTTGRVIAQVIQRAGYDGVVYENNVEGGTSWMVFEPTQIKSADRNVGTFDPHNPSFLAGDLAKTPWVDRTANAVWSRIVAASPKPAWVPLHTTSRGKIKVEEFGCGHYGCVMPTSDPEVVCKITSDATEAVFVAAALGLGFGEETEGIVRYHAVYELQGQHRGRRTFVLWREAAESVGLPHNMRRVTQSHVIVAPEGFKTVERTVEPERAYTEYEIRRVENLRRYLGLFKDFAAAARDSLKRSNRESDFAAVRGYEDWAWDYVSNRDVEVVGARMLAGLTGARRIAVALRACDLIAELMQNTDGCDLIGSALRYYLGEGILLADVHANNVGKVARTSGWVITDPGHAVGLEERWRNVSVPELP